MRYKKIIKTLILEIKKMIPKEEGIDNQAIVDEGGALPPVCSRVVRRSLDL